MKKTQLLICMLAASITTKAQVIDLLSGGGGSITTFGQSYNESRAADVTMLSAVPVNLTSMIAKHLFSGTDNSILVGARIFNTATHALLYSYDTLMGYGYDFTVTIPVDYTLMPGLGYRIGFFCGGASSDNAGLMYQPNYPYNESNNLMQVNAGKESLPDTFPDNQNIFIPVMSMTYYLDTATTIQTLSINRDVYLFYNPVTNSLCISAESAGTCDLLICDMLGRGVMHEQFTREGTYSAQSLPEGLYVYELRAENGIVKQGKLMKR